MTVAVLKPAQSASERVQEIADAIAQRCVESGEPPGTAVTGADLDVLAFDEARVVLRIGLVSLVNDALHRGRSSGSSEPEGGAPGRQPMHAIHGRNPTMIYRALGKPYVGADGTLKPLLHFSAGDLGKLLSDATAQRSTWQKRIGWAKEAARLVAKHGAETVEGLPVEVLADLDAKAAKAWGL
jgi:hypothetical protein